MATEKKSDKAWSQRDETNFINGLGTHSNPDVQVDVNTIETLLNRYRMALCKRGADGQAGFSIPDALQVVDLRLKEIREMRDRIECTAAELRAA